MIRSFLLTSALAVASPALADRSLTLTWAPANAREAQALGLALGIYALSRDIQGSGEVRQTGSGNAAALLQQGAPGSFGLIRQQGHGHQATLTQTAPGQSYAIIQRGQGTTANIVQTAPGAGGITLLYGW
jgi:hypothetical protein